MRSPQQLKFTNKTVSLSDFNNPTIKDKYDSLDLYEDEYGSGKLSERDISFNSPFESSKEIQMIDILKHGEQKKVEIKHFDMNSLNLKDNGKKKVGCFSFFS